MKRLFFLLFVLQMFNFVYGQDLPSIIPPSPNASSFHVNGNIQTNNYTGSPNISIPIFNIEEGDLTLPIYLKYTGGNGIKVEEIASWVGLGWTLNAGGAISRTIRGIADDDQDKLGWLNCDSIIQPTSYYGIFCCSSLVATFSLNEQQGLIDFLNNFTCNDESCSPTITLILAHAQDFYDIFNGNRDGESDNYMYNYPGGSGSFTYNIDNVVQFKPMKNIKIEYEIGHYNESDNISLPHCQNLHEMITKFSLTDESGNIYSFNNKELSNTLVLGTSTNDYRGFPSTWYLSNITNLNKTNQINFEYDAYGYQLVRRKAVIDNSVNEEDQYISTSYLGKRLKRINYKQGSIEFVASTANRKDLKDNKYLDRIIIRDSNDVIIKVVKFSYKYMTDNSFIDVDSTQSVDEKECRLVLNKIEECDGNGNCKNPYIFSYETYESTKYLPARDSKSIDHWGYYNGVNNLILEPFQIIEQMNGSNNEYEIHGSADREPSIEYSKAGVLKKIIYPTGGYSEFEYELNTVRTNEDIPGELVPHVKDLQLNDPFEFEITNYSSFYPVSILEFSCPVGSSDECCDTQCEPVLYVVNLDNGDSYNMSLVNSSLGWPSSILLGAGNYQATFKIIYPSTGNDCNCDFTENQLPIYKIHWRNEQFSPNRKIGGLRLKKVIEHDNFGLAYKKEFEYVDDDGFSSGRIAYFPIYHAYADISDYYVQNGQIVKAHIFQSKRFTTSTLPLMNEQGNTLGYKKIKVIHENNTDNPNGSEEYYYTTAEDYPNAFEESGGSQFLKNKGKVMYPLSEIDNKEYARGLLKKHILYNSNGTSAKETINSYKYLVCSPYDYLISPDEEAEDYTHMFNGLKVWGQGGLSWRYYDLYTGYTLPTETREIQYTNSGEIETITTQKYDEQPYYGLVENFIPIESDIQTSMGETIKTTTKYIVNKNPLTSVEQELYDRNALYLPVKTETFKGNNILSTQKTNYKNWGQNAQGTGDIILPEIIQSAKGEITSTNPLEDRIIYHKYDNHGNPIEVSKASGTHIYYIYGYQHTKPIAKIVNFTQAQAQNLQSEINNVIAASDNDVDTTSEDALRTALSNLRQALPNNTQITTYTYDPLIGVTSITQPNGETVYYEYDNFNRLKYVKNSEGKILKENEYHYKE